MRRAYAYIYNQIVRDLDEEYRLKIDALLGDDQAQRQIDQRRTESIEGMDIEL